MEHSLYRRNDVYQRSILPAKYSLYRQSYFRTEYLVVGALSLTQPPPVL